MNKTKLLCIIGQLGNGGSEKQLFLFLKYLDMNRFDRVTILVTGDAGGIWEKRIQNLNNNEIIFLGKHSFPGKIIKYRKIVSEIQPDKIFSWSFFTNAFYHFSSNKNFVGSLRIQYSSQKQELSFFKRKFCLNIPKFIVNSTYIQNELLDIGIIPEKIKLVNNIFEFDIEKDVVSERKNKIEKIRKQYQIPIDKPLICMAGRNAASKDFPFFINSIVELLKINPGINALVLGTGADFVKKQIEGKNYESHFYNLGEVASLRDFLLASDVFFLSSIQEGMPNVLIEAVEALCPPLAGDIGGVRDIFQLSTEKDREKVFEKSLLSERAPEKAAEMLDILIHDENKFKRSLQLRKKLSDFMPENIMKFYINSLFSEN